MAILLTEDARPLTITDGTIDLAGDIDTGRSIEWTINVSQHAQSGRMPATSGFVVQGRTGSVSMLVSDAGGDDSGTGRRSVDIIDTIDKIVRSAGNLRLVTDSWEVMNVRIIKASWRQSDTEHAAEVSLDWQEIEIVDSQVLTKPGEMRRHGRQKPRAVPVADYEYVATNDLINGNVVQP